MAWKGRASGTPGVVNEWACLTVCWARLSEFPPKVYRSTVQNAADDPLSSLGELEGVRSARAVGQLVERGIYLRATDNRLAPLTRCRRRYIIHFAVGISDCPHGPGKRTRVVVVDRQPLYRAALAAIVRAHSDLELLGEASDEAAGVEAIKRLHPHVVVVGVDPCSGDGLALLDQLPGDRSSTSVLLLSSFEDGPSVYAALEAGASGYLAKDACEEAIAGAIASVARGETVIDPKLARSVAEEIRHRGDKSMAVLSDRECCVLRLTAQGLSSDRVGRELALSRSTVKAHLAHIYAKLGVSSAPAAVAEAMRRGILE